MSFLHHSPISNASRAMIQLIKIVKSRISMKKFEMMIPSRNVTNETVSSQLLYICTSFHHLAVKQLLWRKDSSVITCSHSMAGSLFINHQSNFLLGACLLKVRFILCHKGINQTAWVHRITHSIHQLICWPLWNVHYINHEKQTGSFLS